jgi:hypothetical protein
MSNGTIKRTRKVDVETLSEEQLNNLMAQIGNKLVRMVDKTVEEANKMLAIYGMKSKMQLVLEQKDNNIKE